MFRTPASLCCLLALCLVGCTGPDGPPDADGDGVPDEQDCAPDDRAIRPGAQDPYGDGVDQDCDGFDGVDLDGDGYPGNVAFNDDYGHLQDCDDADPLIHPEADDLVGDEVDQNCDGADGVDADGDGHATTGSGGDDCDDTDNWSYPGATDYVGDGGDQNCDGADGLDADGDGHATPDTLGDDCDDADPAVYPGAPEQCDGLDTDCLFDAGELDEDGDGWLVCAGDCDDTDPTTHPGAVEECNDVDQDCDGNLPNVDGDGDGLAACEGDCDDGDPLVFPGAVEICNGADDDCDSVVPADEQDGDGDGHVPCLGDCDDADGAVFPGQWHEDPGDGVDSDCDGQDSAALLSGASVVLTGASGKNIFGGAVAAAGDVDGDGLADVLVAAPGSSVVGSGAYTGGRTMLYTGAQLSVSGPSLGLWDAHAVLQGEEGLDFSGTSMAGVGDVDGDGLGDIVVGAFGNDEAGQNAGKVYLVSGAAIAAGGTFDLGDPTVSPWQWTGGYAGGELGISVAGAGDVDGDGLADVLVGAHNAHSGGAYSGRVCLILASALGSPGVRSADTITHRFDGEASGEFAGTSVAGGGDVDGDGLSDLLIGAPSADGGGFGSGRVYLWYGAALGSPGAHGLGSAPLILEGVDNNQQAGEVVRFVDDLDGDGRSEVMVGNLSGTAGLRVLLSGDLPASGVVSISGAAHLFPGAITGPSGTSSDVDGDGLADLLIGYPELGSAGGVRLFLGAGLAVPGQHSEADAEYGWGGVGAGDQAGWMVAGVGDVDGDGRADLAAGTHLPGSSAVPGEAYLLLSPF